MILNREMLDEERAWREKQTAVAAKAMKLNLWAVLAAGLLGFIGAISAAKFAPAPQIINVSPQTGIPSAMPKEPAGLQLDQDSSSAVQGFQKKD